MARCLFTPWLDILQIKYSDPLSNAGVKGTYHDVLGKMAWRKLLLKKKSYVNADTYGSPAQIDYNTHIFRH